MPGPRRRPRGVVTVHPQDGDQDDAVVRRAHVADRMARFAMMGLPRDALERLCEGQHMLQERHVVDHHPAADRRMLAIDGVTIGRLCVDRIRDPWRIVDIALVPEAQGLGHGSAALRMLLSEAQQADIAVDLHVGCDNPRAEALYRRLGFVDALSASGTHVRLIRVPSSAVYPS